MVLLFLTTMSAHTVVARCCGVVKPLRSFLACFKSSVIYRMGVFGLRVFPRGIIDATGCSIEQLSAPVFVWFSSSIITGMVRV